MTKELLDDEIEFPDEIISFLKVKYPKAYTDQEKAVLKQIEQLTEEKKELKDIISKKREQAKIKSLPVNITPSEEAKEKAIKLVQDGTLLLSSKTKTIDLDDQQSDNQFTNTGPISQKLKSRPSDDHKQMENVNSIKPPTASNAAKISFVSAGYAFTDDQSKVLLDQGQETNLKRSLSVNSAVSELASKKSRHISGGSSDSEENEKINMDKGTSDNRSANSSVLRFCGHNMKEDFVRRIVEPYGTIVSLEVEDFHNNSVNIVVAFENPDVARVVKEKLDSQYLEGRVVSVYFKQGDFSRRPYRRRRNRNEFGRSRSRFPFQRPKSFSQVEHDNILPSHYMAGGDAEENTGRRMPWRISEETESNGDKMVAHSTGTLTSQSERSVVQYDDLYTK